VPAPPFFDLPLLVRSLSTSRPILKQVECHNRHFPNFNSSKGKGRSARSELGCKLCIEAVRDLEFLTKPFLMNDLVNCLVN
jgi:hypothetical protein